MKRRLGIGGLGRVRLRPRRRRCGQRGLRGPRLVVRSRGRLWSPLFGRGVFAAGVAGRATPRVPCPVATCTLSMSGRASGTSS